MKRGAVLTLALVAGAASGCPATARDGDLLAEGTVTLAWRAAPARIVVGTPFALEIVACPEDARLVAVDATMPEHRHGMNYKPSLKALGGGRWRADGLLWHMSGRWQLRFDVQRAGATQTLTRDFTLP